MNKVRFGLLSVSAITFTLGALTIHAVENGGGAVVNGNAPPRRIEKPERPLSSPKDTGATSRDAYTIKLSSPTDLTAIFKKAAVDLLGGSDIPQSEIDKFVIAYQGMERADQQKAIGQAREAANAQAGTTQPLVPGATNSPSEGLQPAAPNPLVQEQVATPSAQAAAEEQLNKDFPELVNGTQLANTQSQVRDDHLEAGSVTPARSRIATNAVEESLRISSKSPQVLKKWLSCCFRGSVPAG